MPEPRDVQLTLEHRHSHCNEEPVGAPYAKGSETSKAAAKKVAKRIEQQRGDVYLCIVRGGASGRTWDEIVTALACSPTANGRCTELRDMGLIHDSGLKRRTRRGSLAVVWVATKLEERSI